MYTIQKTIIVEVFFFIMIMMTYGCAKPNPASEVYVSVLPQQYIVERIAGDTISVDHVVPENQSPEAYIPLPKTLKDLETAKVFFTIGMPYEKRLLKSLSEKGARVHVHFMGEYAKYIDMNDDHVHDHVHEGEHEHDYVHEGDHEHDYVHEGDHDHDHVHESEHEHDHVHEGEHGHDYVHEGDHDHLFSIWSRDNNEHDHVHESEHDHVHESEHDHVHESEHDHVHESDHTHFDQAGYYHKDLHVWMDVSNLILLGKSTYETLLAIYPKHKKTFKKNYEAFQKELEILAITIDTILNPHRGKSFLINHPALGYLANEYDLEQIGIKKHHGEAGGKHIREIMERANTLGLTTIFIQKGFDANSLKSVANHINAKLVEINPLQKNCFGNLLDIAYALEGSFQK